MTSGRSRIQVALIALVALIAPITLLGSPGAAAAQSLQLSLESSEVYAGMPFVLSLAASGFAEQPEPEVSELEIAGCQVVPLGMTPNVRSMIQIINGRRSESREVTFVYRYRILAERPGTYTVPPMVVSQGGRNAETPQGTFDVRDIATTTGMRLNLVLPDEPVWVGQTVDVSVEWDLSADVNDQNLVIPLFSQSADVSIEPAPSQGRRTLGFIAGNREIALPYDSAQVVVDGQQMTRLRFFARMTPQRAGTIHVPASSVVARMQVGMGRDSFGFRSPRYQLFRADDFDRALEVRPLPASGRPAGYTGAVGQGFSIEVEAGRTVVRQGDPVELTVTIRGHGNVEGLRLPPLDQVGLDPAAFTLPTEAPVGEPIEDGSGRLFRLTVRVRATDVREIPAVEFPFFDPQRGAYEIATSTPIALSVTGSAMVRADDVVVGAPTAGAQPAEEGRSTSTASTAPLESLVGADLSLSAPEDTMRRPLAGSGSPGLMIALYLLPIGLFGSRIWFLRSRSRRHERSAVRQAVGELRRSLRDARTAPARDAAPNVASALKGLARATGADLADANRAIERLETLSFDPAASSSPIEESLRDEVADLARRWEKGGSAAVGRAGSLAALLALGLAVGGFGALGHAQDGTEAALAGAREAYHGALAAENRSEQIAQFAAAEAGFGAVAAANPGRPELLTDWGNAALGARDIGLATLAYRRALHVDSRLSRASANLQWVRSRAPAWLPRPETGGTIEALFFWRTWFTPAQRDLVAGALFGLVVLLLAPWGRQHALRRRLRVLAVAPALAWAVLIGSSAFDPDVSSDAVVVSHGTVVRSADNAGAPPSFTNPLPAGAEVRLLESRQGWARIALGAQSTGWVSTEAVQPVVADGG